MCVSVCVCMCVRSRSHHRYDVRVLGSNRLQDVQQLLTQYVLCILCSSLCLSNKCTYIHNCAVVLYGCETWSLTLREERRLRVFENRVMRRILGLRGRR